MFIRLLVLAAFLGSALRMAAADDVAEKAADIVNMRKIWEAIQAYRKAKGDVPAYLNELVPEFLPDKRVLISPRDGEDGPSSDDSNDPNLPCSYTYHFIGEGKKSQNAAMKKQMEEFGGIVPILSRPDGDRTLHVSYGGEVFESKEAWYRSEFVSDWLDRRGIDPARKNCVPVTIAVVDSNGKPVPDVKVTAHRGTPVYGLPDRSATSGADGMVILPVHKGQEAYADFVFEKSGLKTHPRYWPIRDRDGVPVADPESPMRVIMHPSVNASGIIRDPDGKPVQGAWLALNAIDEKGDELWLEPVVTKGPTGADGRWELESFPGGGRYKVRVSETQFRIFDENLSENGVPDLAAMIAGRGDIKLLAPYTFNGRVTAGGKPAARAAVWLKSVFQTPSDVRNSCDVASTGDDGAFSGQSPYSDKGQIIAHAKGYAPRLINYDGKFLPIELDRGRVMKGRVVDRAGSGVAGVPVLLYAIDDFYLFKDQPVIATTGPDGNFEWPDAPANAVTMRLLLPSGLEWNRQVPRNHKRPLKIEVPLQPN